MTDNRLNDYIGHIRQAASDACSFVDGLAKETVQTALPELLAKLPAPSQDS